MDCVFCKIIANQLPAHKVYEDESCVAFLDRQPVNPGHTLVVSKQHFVSMVDAPAEVVGQLAKVAKKVGAACIAATGAKGYNLSVNNGAAAGQVVFHLHFHVIPRQPSDEFKLWEGKDYKTGEPEQIATLMREKLL